MLVIENNVEEYDANEFDIIHTDDVEIIKKPDEVSDSILLEEAIRYQIKESGEYIVSPFSFNWNQHSQIYSIIAGIKKYTNDMSISSCRLDAIARDKYLTKVIREFNSEGIVVAIEGISNKIRQFLQKGIMEEDILIAIESIFKENVRKIKLYYIYTGRETEEDIKELEGFLKILDQFKRDYHRESISILFSFTYLTPTSYTALQYNPPKDVEESLVDTENALIKINRIIVTYGFEFKVSASRVCNDIIEFTDRRAASLFEYVSINGIHIEEKKSILFYDGEVEISKEEFSRECGYKLQIKDKYYKARKMEKMTNVKIYKLINENKVYSEITLKEINEIFERFEGKRIRHEILESLGRRKQSLEGRKVHIEKNNLEECISVVDKNKKQIKTVQIAFGASKLVVDFIRSWLPIFTGGVSHTDIIQEKNALYIFPHFHIKFHKNRHMGFHYFKYASIKKGLIDSYCLKGILSKCVECGSCNDVEEIKNIVKKDREFGKEGYEKILRVVKDTDPKYSVWVEVEVEPGKYSAMKEAWLQIATHRAILKASNGELTKSLLPNKTWSTRKKYLSFEREFVNLLSGKIIYELKFNSEVVIDTEYIEKIKQGINEHTTKGWKISNIKISHTAKNTAGLRSKIDLTSVEYKFDTRKVNIKTLEGLIERFNSASFIMKCEKRKRVKRKTIQNTLNVFDKGKVKSLKSRSEIGGRDIMYLDVVLDSKVHPAVFLDGFLGNSGQNNIRKIDTRIKGFFTERKFEGFNTELIKVL